MKLQFCGVRGSTPAPGPEFVRVGGHTSCVAVWPDGAEQPRLLLDAGTGIRAVTPLLGGAAFQGTILLTHLHWDHVQGLPFFVAGDRRDAVVQLLLPADGVGAATQLGRAMSPPHFPIGPEGLQGTWRFDLLDEGEHRLEGLRVVAGEVPHKGGRTFGYRVEGGSGSIAYLPDHRPAPGGAHRRAALALAADADVLVHDAQFTASEAAVADAYGHATVEQAVAFAAEAGVAELVLFHHAPGRSDDDVADMAAAIGPVRFCVTVAMEGTTIELDRREAPA